MMTCCGDARGFSRTDFSGTTAISQTSIHFQQTFQNYLCELNLKLDYAKLAINLFGAQDKGIFNNDLFHAGQGFSNLDLLNASELFQP